MLKLIPENQALFLNGLILVAFGFVRGAMMTKPSWLTVLLIAFGTAEIIYAKYRSNQTSLSSGSSNGAEGSMLNLIPEYRAVWLTGLVLVVSGLVRGGLMSKPFWVTAMLIVVGMASIIFARYRSNQTTYSRP
jgi:hypothetical protein